MEPDACSRDSSIFIRNQTTTEWYPFCVQFKYCEGILNLAWSAE